MGRVWWSTGDGLDKKPGVKHQWSRTEPANAQKWGHAGSGLVVGGVPSLDVLCDAFIALCISCNGPSKYVHGLIWIFSMPTGICRYI